MDHRSLFTRKQTLFFQNLLALGFDVAAMTKEHKIAFDKKMFSLPNKKAFEVVSYFLFSKLNEVSVEKYSITWPLFDAKDQRQFQKTCFDYLTRISKESDIKFPLVLNSVFATLGGEAFFELYFAFSTHVVQQVNKTFRPMLRRPKCDPKYKKHAIEMLKLTSISSVDNFQVLTDTTKFHLETYFHIAKKFADCVESLKLSNSRSRSLLEEKIKTALKILTKQNNFVENSLEEITLKNKEYCNKVEGKWKKLEDFLSKEENIWDCISSELEDNTKPILKGSSCSFSLSNHLKNCYEERYETELPEEKSFLHIPRFLKLFSLALESYTDSIKKGKFSETYQCTFQNDTSELEKSLKMLQSFCTLLEESNAVNKKHVDDLMDKVNPDDFIKNKTDFLEDLPPSPEDKSKTSVDFENLNGSTFFYPLDQDVILDGKNEGRPLMDNSLKQIDQIINEDDSVFFPIQKGEMESVTSSSYELNSCGSNNDGSLNQIFSKSSVNKDLLLNLTELIPPSYLHEESLNSQTLSDQASFSFLD